jgi:trimethylamine--corrinoid protein Co-methyltransferase
MLRAFTRNFRPLEILTDEQIEGIHRGTLDVLWQTGVRCESKRALRLFEKNDCSVDYDEMSVHLPPGLVEECLRKCPSSFRVKARNPKNDVIIGGNTLNFISNVGMQTVDLATWEPREATRKENYDAVKVLDALENLNILIWYSPYYGFEGVPPIMAVPESFAAEIRNSAMVAGTGSPMENEVWSIRMAQAVGAELLGPVTLSPPLTIYEDQIRPVFNFAEANMPLFVGSGATGGATSPATIAGRLVSTNAEKIAVLALAQLIRPGMRVVPVDFSFPQNMQTGAPGFGQIGISLQAVAFNQIWRKYGIPTLFANYNSSKKIDFQGGYEKVTQMWLAALSGSNVICVHGSISSELTFHPIQAILDDDVAGMIGHYLDGIEVDDETLAIDLINEVGPIPGHYLNKRHTREWWKKEQYLPRAADRLTYPEWMKEGKKDCIDLAKERMEEILATHKVDPPLTPGQEEDIERILNEARKYYRDKGQISDTEWTLYLKDLKSKNYPYG